MHSLVNQRFYLIFPLVRQKVLTHHPDKQTAEAQQAEGDDLFKCIKIGIATRH